MLDYYLIFKIGEHIIFSVVLLILFIIYIRRRKKRDNYSKVDVQASYMEGYEDAVRGKRPKSFFEQ